MTAAEASTRIEPPPRLRVVDAGIRAWYESCRCCLSDAHPQIVAVLDRERAAVEQAPADAGICANAELHGA